MKMNYAIKLENVYKGFSIPESKKTTLQSYFINPFERSRYMRLNTLIDINFEVNKGEFFSVIGPNGAGKSTLLKLISGIYVADTGKVLVNGTLVPFLELGVGFHPDLTARENVYLNAVLLGLTHSEVDSYFNEIFEFAELEDFIDVPIRKYSSGMYVRLAFSVAIRVKSDILVLDEVLAVGDEEFQRKCYKYFDQIKGKKTIVFVSHDLDSVEKYSDRVMYINSKHSYDIGCPIEMIKTYKSDIESF